MAIAEDFANDVILIDDNQGDDGYYHGVYDDDAGGQPTFRGVPRRSIRKPRFPVTKILMNKMAANVQRTI